MKNNQRHIDSFIAESFKKMEADKDIISNNTLFNEKQKAFKQFEALGFPNTKIENWKYTDLSKLLNSPFQEAIYDSEQEVKNTFSIKNANTIVILNGQFQKNKSNIIDKAITIKKLDEAFKEDSEAINSTFNKITQTNKESLIELNTALSKDGIYINIPKNSIIEHPIYIQYINRSSTPSIIQNRSLVIANEHSQATIIEQYIGESKADILSNSVLECLIHKHAHIKHYKIQTEGKSNNHITYTLIKQHGNSVYTNTTCTLGGNITRNNINVELDGEHIETNLNGLYLTKDKQHVDNTTIVEHLKSNCQSNELYKGIMTDESTGVFTGKVIVHPDAQKTNAFQSNKNILLSDNATINTKPQLEIFADDVKCSHGATIGQLDEEAIFYLNARGIPTKQAEALLTFAFANDILKEIEIESIQNYLETSIKTQLNI